MSLFRFLSLPARGSARSDRTLARPESTTVVTPACFSESMSLAIPCFFSKSLLCGANRYDRKKRTVLSPPSASGLISELATNRRHVWLVFGPYGSGGSAEEIIVAGPPSHVSFK